MTAAPSPTRPDRRAPYLFAYDIGDPKRARAVRKCLQRWRLDGQYSVHETRLLPFQVRELTAELLDYVHPRDDALLLCRLSRHGGAPIMPLSLTRDRRPPLLGPAQHGAVAPTPPSGWYLLAYDVREPRRLQRVQRRTAKACLFLQRSVYLYHGAGRPLLRVLAAVQDELEHGEDDARLYRLHGPGDLWFLSGPVPPLAATPAASAGLWQRLLHWFRSLT